MDNQIEKICPFCGNEISEDDAKKVCPECSVQHHEKCWEAHNGCSSPECSLYFDLKPATDEQNELEKTAVVEEMSKEQPEAATEIPSEAEASEEHAQEEELAKTASEEQNESAAEQHIEKTCAKCGAIIMDGASFCPSCGTNTAVVAAANSSIEEFNKNIANAQKKKKRFLVLWLPIIVGAVIIATVLSVFLYFIPNSKYQEAKDLYSQGEYESAIEIFEELGGFKDSPEQIEKCRTAIKQSVYDEAIKLFESNNHSGAIELLLTIKNFSDSEKKIKEIEDDYLSDAQIAYALIARGYDMDKALGKAVYNVLLATELYDGYISTAMSKLYSGNSYRVYYYWSIYSNGYEYIVESSAAQAFEKLLELTNENMDAIELAMMVIKNAPEKYKGLYTAMKNLNNKYSEYHGFINKQPSVSWTSYSSSKSTKEKSVDSAMSEARSKTSKITGKVSEYKWVD